MADAQTRARSADADNVTEAQKEQTAQNVAVIGLAREQIIHQDDMALANKKLAADTQQQAADRVSNGQQQAADRASDSQQQSADRAADMFKHLNPQQTQPGVFPGGRVQ